MTKSEAMKAIEEMAETEHNEEKFRALVIAFELLKREELGKGWTSAEEEVPDLYESCAVIVKKGDLEGLPFVTIGRRKWREDWDVDWIYYDEEQDEVTHWCYLPKLPSGVVI